jgi:hypothetical protein
LRYGVPAEHRISFLFPACAANFPEELFMDDESGTNMAQGGMVRLISGVFFS